ncbi:MAG: IreB family regulatory phosphoprotein [Clostridiaceae bacterium]|nr:IreB family regulatory phosphoprotein [Clostridiaceae bacterium]
MANNNNKNYKNNNETMMFNVEKDNACEAREILTAIYQALKERGYNPINQIVGYILSGDPTYITNHKNARSLVRKLERDELLEEVLKYYLNETK